MTEQPCRFIVLEGLDEWRTTTQAERLVNGRTTDQAHLTAEPSDGPIGRLIRDVLRVGYSGRMATAFRREQGAGFRRQFRPLHSEIQPKLDAGTL